MLLLTQIPLNVEIAKVFAENIERLPDYRAISMSLYTPLTAVLPMFCMVTGHHC